MTDLIEWLRAQLDVDEKGATAVFRDHTWAAYREGGADGWAVEGAHSGEPSCIVGDEAMAAHIARHDPARVLREVEAKRKVIDAYERATADEHETNAALVAALRTGDLRAIPKAQEAHRDALGRQRGLGQAVRLLALPYSNRPDYREEWKL